MPNYMLQVAYTPDAWAAQIQNPANRMDTVRTYIQNVGGKLQSAWYCFGKYDRWRSSRCPTT